MRSDPDFQSIMSITKPLYFFGMLPTSRTLTRHQGISYIELDSLLRNFWLHYHQQNSFLVSFIFQRAWINTLATFTTLWRHNNISKSAMNYFLRIIIKCISFYHLKYIRYSMTYFYLWLNFLCYWTIYCRSSAFFHCPYLNCMSCITHHVLHAPRKALQKQILKSCDDTDSCCNRKLIANT